MSMEYLQERLKNSNTQKEVQIPSGQRILTAIIINLIDYFTE